MAESTAFKAIVRGTVQGVGFRYFTMRQAQKLGVTGYVRNLPNGDVEVCAEGDQETLSSLLAAVKRGPLGAYVQDVNVDWQNASEQYPDFRITY